MNRQMFEATAKINFHGQGTRTRIKKIISVIGARPQFIKAAPVSKALVRLCDGFSKSRRVTEMIVHTGQHYDSNMSEDICNQLGVVPQRNLGINGGSHGAQTAAMIRELEAVFVSERPDLVLVYGDTNSTIAGSLAAAKLGIRIGHVEAGLRSFNRAMPEEINRVVTDHVSDILFAPTEAAVRNLAHEGIHKNVHLVGDVMFDAVQENLARARQESHILERLGIEGGGYILATIHRAENTVTAGHLQRIVDALIEVSSLKRIIWPLHPRTRKALDGPPIAQLDNTAQLTIIEPVPYLDMLILESNAQTIVTDSGGVQKEAAWLGVPCVTVRNETEWVETVESGWNVLAGTQADSIIDAISCAQERRQTLAPFPVLTGAADSVAKSLVHWLM